MAKYLFLLYIALGIYLLSGYSSDTHNTQQYDTSCTTEQYYGNETVYRKSESQSGKKEINKEKYHLAKTGIGRTESICSWRTCCPSKILKFHPTPSVLARTARLLKILLPEDKETFFSPPILSNRYPSEYYIFCLKRILI
ncbi:hypothetical protein [Phocaeicola barnesiae]|uniref:hypothetical protein n=1 Tax=Phocaeicola barnesiae TaxID=376804 RepID=UPI000371818F|nr:hypothetical protein [Phocaeicola barnesiae]